MQGVFVDGRRPKSKKAVKEAVADNPERVSLEATSLHGGEFDGRVSELPVGGRVRRREGRGEVTAQQQVELRCDGWCEGRGEVAMIDTAGFAYCEPCGLRRRQSEPCRKLRSWELRKLQRGEQLARY